jgi:hypothetical protein
MHLVVNFPESYSKLDLDNVCERNNSSSDWGSVVELDRFPLQNPLGFHSITS